MRGLDAPRTQRTTTKRELEAETCTGLRPSGTTIDVFRSRSREFGTTKGLNQGL